MRKLLLLPVFVLALAASSPSSASTPNTVVINITATGFNPASVNVQNGDVVVWKNVDTTSHQVVADDGSFKSDVLAPGAEFSHAFSSAGTFGYHGAINPTLHGSVNVALTRWLLMSQSRNTVTYVTAVNLRGTTSSEDSGDTVIIEARPAGTDDFTEVARTATFSGHWALQVRPRRTTEYRAVWNNITSQVHTVNVKPALRLKQTGRSFLWAYAQADGVRIRHALLQRWQRHHGWRTIRVLSLNRLRQKANQQWMSFGKYPLRFRHGAILRLRVTRAQAGPAMYGPAFSKALRL